AAAGARVVREELQLRDELGFRLGIALQAAERVAGVEVQLRDLERARLLQLGAGLQEERQRLGVLALVVEQASFDVQRQRQRRVLLAREPGLFARRLGVVLRERDLG